MNGLDAPTLFMRTHLRLGRKNAPEAQGIDAIELHVFQGEYRGRPGGAVENGEFAKGLAGPGRADVLIVDGEFHNPAVNDVKVEGFLGLIALLHNDIPRVGRAGLKGGYELLQLSDI